ncbi:hypothetical protein B0H34DRAFT_22780 [Crassisporium funariophilum]|nr:hypothetical protein B0H34DRAFT_22780 [Crassisporium funariophilum]
MPVLVPSRSSSTSSYTAASHVDDPRMSISGLSDSTFQTAVSDYKDHKSLPALPPKTLKEDFAPYARHPPPLIYDEPLAVFTTTSQLASALGPDTTPHSTEIDTVPCAGVRIPHGPLTGLLAWRLVVRLPPRTKGKRTWLNDNSNNAAAKQRRRSYAFPPPLPPHSYSEAHTVTQTQIPTHYHSASLSALSLPITHPRKASPSLLESDLDTLVNVRPSSAMLARRPHVHSTHNPHIDLHPQLSKDKNWKPPPPPTAFAVNFILDTSLPYSIISRETLVALGYPAHLFGELVNADPDTPPTVTLSIQSITTSLRIARPGEASRLGVQFLRDASISVFFPRDGEGVGPVFYRESCLSFLPIL